MVCTRRQRWGNVWAGVRESPYSLLFWLWPGTGAVDVGRESACKVNH